VLAVVGLGLLAATAAISLQPTRNAPHLTEAFFVADLHERRFYRASQLPNLDSWARSALSMGGAQARHTQWAPLFRDPIWLAAAPPLTIEGPEFHGSADALGTSYRITLRARSAQHGRSMHVLIKPSVALTDTAVDEKPAALSPARGQWSEIDYYAPGQDEIALSFTARERGSMDVWVLEVRDGWPSTMTAMPARPTAVVPWRNSDTTLIADRLSMSW
jgi:hypothetical protein